MKFLKLLLLLPIVVFSFEVEFNKKFSQELVSDTLTTNITIKITDDTELLVGNRLDIYNKKIKSYDKVERKLNSFYIWPKYRHSNSTPKVIAYVGELRYKVNSSKARYMDEFINEITKLKRNRDTTISISNLSWTVREDTYNDTLDLLRLKAINWGQKYAINLSQDILKECSIKNIDINTTRQIMPLDNSIVYTSALLNKKSIPVPESNQERIKINPNYILECK